MHGRASSIADLTDAIYEAAVLPDRWPHLLGEIAAASGTLGGALITLPTYVVPLAPHIASKIRWAASRTEEEMIAAFFGEGWLGRCEWVRRARELQHPFFVTEQDLFAPGEFETTPSHAFYRRFGIGCGAGLFMNLPSQDLFAFDFSRRFEDGPFTPECMARLDELRPHLARAAFISARLGLERAKAATQALAILGLPAAMLCARRRIIDMNELMSGLMPAGACQGGHGTFHLADRKADDLLKDALSIAASGTACAGGVLSVPVPRSESRPAAVAHVLPLRGQARDLFVSASSIVVVTPLVDRNAPAANVIRGLFDLTAAEARIARLIAAGETVRSAAAKCGTSEGTVRMQLKSVFAKTGVVRQAELVSLLGGAALPVPQARPT